MRLRGLAFASFALLSCVGAEPDRPRVSSSASERSTVTNSKASALGSSYVEASDDPPDGDELVNSIESKEEAEKKAEEEAAAKAKAETEKEQKEEEEKKEAEAEAKENEEKKEEKKEEQKEEAKEKAEEAAGVAPKNEQEAEARAEKGDEEAVKAEAAVENSIDQSAPLSKQFVSAEKAAAQEHAIGDAPDSKAHYQEASDLREITARTAAADKASKAYAEYNTQKGKYDSLMKEVDDLDAQIRKKVEEEVTLSKKLDMARKEWQRRINLSVNPSGAASVPTVLVQTIFSLALFSFL